MRTILGVGLAAVCLGLAGCSLVPGKPGTPPAGSDNPFPPVTRTLPRNLDPNAPPPEADNLLAGQVVDRTYNKRRGNVSIQVVDLEDSNAAPTARLDVRADNEGYFFIPGLQRGHHYQLIARIKETDHLLTGTTLAMPPNPRLSITISEDLASPSTPPPLGPPTVPGKGDDRPDPKAALPSVGLDPPARIRPDAGPGGSQDQGNGSPPINKSNVAIDGGAGAEPGGFEKVAPAPKVEIPWGTPPGPPIPPPPPLPKPEVSTAPAGAPPGGQTSQFPLAHKEGPFCVLVGNRLDDFALAGLDGKQWQFRRDPPRKLVLLDFWKSNCPPCLAAVPRLCDLQEKYGPDGLEVVGVAYEDPSSPAEQIANVRGAKARTKINYTVLLGADTRTSPCPVRSQFLVDAFPRLVLLDGSGEILWRSSPEGLDPGQIRELEQEIYRKFHPPAK